MTGPGRCPATYAEKSRSNAGHHDGPGGGRRGGPGGPPPPSSESSEPRGLTNHVIRKTNRITRTTMPAADATATQSGVWLAAIMVAILAAANAAVKADAS